MPDPAHLQPFEISLRLADLAEGWAETSINERGGFQTYLIRFCEALDVEPPDPPMDDYRFELPIRMMDREGRESTNFIDCWKAGHFALEAKASATGAIGLDDPPLRRAYGQVRNYVAHVSGDPPPYLMVLDVARTIIVWDRWSGAYGDFAAGRRIALPTLHERPDDIALLRDIFVDPTVRDPRGKAQVVSKEIAAGLAELAAELEARGMDTERVARFLMRCVFSCFAEDVGLLPENLFRRTLETARNSGDRERLTLALTTLWKTMDSGGMFGADLLHRFNGHFFKTVEALPLEARDVDLLIDAAKHDWSRVEPSIFGTLLVRALDPEERHRLGAEYTPREYIERLVEPTVVEPIRERWTAVQAAVLQLEESKKKKDVTAGIKQLRDFHEWMRGLSFLDPACGSGNFLYVTMAAVKRIELEVLNEIERSVWRPGRARPRRGASAAVPRHRGKAVGARDRRADAVDRLSPVLARIARRADAAGSDSRGHRDDRVSRRGACVGLDRASAGEGSAGSDAANRASGDGRAGAGSECEAAVQRVCRRATGGVAEGGFHRGESAVPRRKKAARGTR